MRIKRFALVLAIAGLMSALPVAIGYAATLCVNPNGSNGCSKTISGAVSLAKSGDTINIAPGRYAEEVTITEPINLQGVGAHGQAVIIDATGLAHAIYVSGVTSPMTISGVTAENANREGILIENSSYVTVENSTVQNNDKNLSLNSMNYSCSGAFPFDQDDCGEGLHLRSSTYCVVQNNIVENNAGGILLTDETGPNHDNLVTGNRVLDNVPDCGITMPSHPQCKDTSATDSTGCTANVGPTAPPAFGVYNNIVSNNLSMGNGAAGTGIFAPTPGTMAYGNMVIRNILEDNQQGGVVLHSHNAHQNLNNNVIVGNLISGNGGDPDSEGASPPPVGIVVFSDKAMNLSATPPKTTAAPIVGTLVSHNTIKNEDVDVWVGNTATNLTLMLNNLLGAGSLGVDNTGSGTVSAMDNYWGCPNGPGTGQCSNASGTVVNAPFLSQPVSKRN